MTHQNLSKTIHAVLQVCDILSWWQFNITQVVVRLIVSHVWVQPFRDIHPESIQTMQGVEDVGPGSLLS
jgi:hypothetical protein